MQIKSAFLFLIFIFSVTLFAGSAEAFSVTGISAQKISGKTRISLDLSQEVKFRVFTLNSPERLVIDIPNATWNAGTGLKDASGIIGNYRRGIFKNDTMRLVFDLKKPIKVLNAYIPPVGPNAKSRLIVDVTPCSKTEFAKNLSSVTGTLSDSSGRPGSQMQSASVKKPVMVLDEKENTPDKTVIVIDPGHGGNDPGAIAVNGVREKDITLAMAKKLKNKLINTGMYTVYLTRDTDRFIKLRDRTKIARKKGADLFISLHADSIGKDGVRGASLYTLSDVASDKESAMLAERENKADTLSDIDLSGEEADVADILIDLAMRDTMNQSKTMADYIVKSLSSNRISLLERPLRSAGFAVLKAPDMPAILIETGYLSSEREASLLSSPEYQNRLAEAIAKGIDTYAEKRQLSSAF